MQHRHSNTVCIVKFLFFLVDELDNGSIITMTSDERVQIYVPSPLETTPYNTITRQVEQVKD